MHPLVEDLGGKGAASLAGLAAGAAMTWGYARWRAFQDRRSILRGDARDTVVVHYHLVQAADRPDPADPARTARVPTAMRIRAVGQAELGRVIPNAYQAGEFAARARRATAADPLISMDGAEGSYLLETLTGWVGEKAGVGGFDRRLYVMAPCCEPADLAQHQPVTVLLVAADDLPLFEHWPTCRGVEVEHGGDGCRVLTLMALARRFRAEQEQIAGLRAAGRRTRFVEAMYLLDLALDPRFAAVPTKPVPWGRFEPALKAMNLE